MALMAAVASATNFGSAYKAAYDPSKPGVTIHNRCGHPLTMWSVMRESGCPSSDPSAVVPHGGKYQENYRKSEGGIAISIKISGEDTCDPKNLTQVEYNHETTNPGYNGNYVDMSYVNCESGNCPSRKSGFWYKIGNHPDSSGSIPMKFKMDSNQNCPIWSCKGLQPDGTDDCHNKAYVKYNDDFANRFCDIDASWEVYLCDPAGPDGNAGDDSSSAQPSKKPESSAAPSSEKPSSTEAASSPSSVIDIKAAAVTKAPEVEEKPALKTKYETVVVTTTVVEEYRARRHVHGHQRRGNYHA